MAKKRKPKKSPAIKKGKLAKARKAVKRAKKPDGKLRKEYRNLYQKIWRRKKKIEELDPRKKGYKSQRTILYKELTELNADLLSVGKKLQKATAEEFKKPRAKKPKFDTEEKTRTYSAKVWEFESQLKDYLVEKKFTKIVFPETGKTFYIKKHKPSTILAAYDEARNLAYMKQFSGTPIVEVTEDYKTRTITIQIVS